jgi:hypothetical protein
MKKTTKLIPLIRHKRSQNAGVVYTLVDEVDALMWISSRTKLYAESGLDLQRELAAANRTLPVICSRPPTSTASSRVTSQPTFRCRRRPSTS